MEIIGGRDSRLNKQNPENNKTISYHIEHDIVSHDMLDYVKKEIDATSDLFFTAEPGRYGIDGTFNTRAILKDHVLFNITEIIANRMLDINRNIFHLDITHKEYAIINKYDVGQSIGWHKDEWLFSINSKNDNSIYRKLIGILNLDSIESYIGGDFQIMTLEERPDSCIHNIRADAGTLIVFPAILSHRVTEITYGTRRTIVVKMDGPRWR